MKKIAAFLAIAFTLSVPLAGCNTMRGAGQDIQQGGQKLEDSAEKKR
jgi:predicted small secreted protein